jgi:hypothetical protein
VAGRFLSRRRLGGLRVERAQAQQGSSNGQRQRAQSEANGLRHEHSLWIKSIGELKASAGLTERVLEKGTDG